MLQIEIDDLLTFVRSDGFTDSLGNRCCSACRTQCIRADWSDTNGVRIGDDYCRSCQKVVK